MGVLGHPLSPPDLPRPRHSSNRPAFSRPPVPRPAAAPQCRYNVAPPPGPVRAPPEPAPRPPRTLRTPGASVPPTHGSAPRPRPPYTSRPSHRRARRSTHGSRSADHDRDLSLRQLERSRRPAAPGRATAPRRGPRGASRPLRRGGRRPRPPRRAARPAPPRGPHAARPHGAVARGPLQAPLLQAAPRALPRPRGNGGPTRAVVRGLPRAAPRTRGVGRHGPLHHQRNPARRAPRGRRAGRPRLRPRGSAREAGRRREIRTRGCRLGPRGPHARPQANHWRKTRAAASTLRQAGTGRNDEHAHPEAGSHPGSLPSARCARLARHHSGGPATVRRLSASATRSIPRVSSASEAAKLRRA